MRGGEKTAQRIVFSPPKEAFLAQLVEHMTFNHGVKGSKPLKSFLWEDSKVVKCG